MNLAINNNDRVRTFIDFLESENCENMSDSSLTKILFGSVNCEIVFFYRVFLQNIFK